MECRLKLRDGRGVVLPAQARGNALPSFFVLSLPKAGSTLLNRLIRPLSAAAGFSYFSLPNTLQEMGVSADSVDFRSSDPIFQPTGQCYGGFRGMPGTLELPIFAQGRSVLLVRDPRDMLTSLYFSVAFSHRPPPVQQGAGYGLSEQFNQKRLAARESAIDEYVLERASHVLRLFESMAQKSAAAAPKLYRYEDVIFDKLRWMQDLLDHLEIKLPSRTIEAIVQRHDVRPDKENPAEHIRRVTPGDHREKLAPRTISLLNETLQPVLSRYDYT